MPLLPDSFLEMVMLAAAPAAAADAIPQLVEQPYRSPVHAVIGAAVDDARRSGRRAAVCLVDLSRSDAQARPSVNALEAAVAGCLRRADQYVRVGDALVVVAPGLDHPAQGDRLAERLRAVVTTGDRDGVVGMAIYPVHGRDAAALLDSARASALRARLGSGLLDGDPRRSLRAVS